ncbi:MAG: hypothetical protein ACM31D_07385 [Bacteroidota bacterium]
MLAEIETRALSARDIQALLAVLVRDADEAGMALTAKAVEFALSVAKSEMSSLVKDNVVALPGVTLP